jgi:uncharacterized protein YbjT (DUF2867 family)
MIVITTPTGQIGRQVIDRLLGTGEMIRVIARDPSRLSPRVRERVSVVPGSHGESDVVTKAFTGADCVFWLVPPNARADSPERYYRDFTRPACEAIKNQGVRRVVGVSTLGHGYHGRAGVLSAALAMDDLIERTGTGYRALAMPFFMENLLRQAQAIRDQGLFLLANAADRPLPTIATRDIAAVAVPLLLDGSWTGQARVPVASPDDLTPAEMAQVMSEVLRRTIRFQQVPLADFKAMALQSGASEERAQSLVDMVEAQNHGIYDSEPRGRHSPAPTSFRQWCQDTLKPALQA